MGGFLDRGGDLLVGRVGGFGEVMASPLGLIGEQFGQTLVGRAPLGVRGALDHHRLENRVPEPQLADAVIDHDEMVAFGRPELLESSGAARCRQHPEVAASVQRGEQEQATRRLREPPDPRLVQRSQLPARSRRRGGVVAVALAAGRCGELQQGQRIAFRLLDDAPQEAGRQVDEPARQQLHRLRVGEWRDRELRQSGALEEPADTRPDRTEEPDPAAAQPPADEPHHGTARTIQPVKVVDDDEQRAARRRLTEQRQRCTQHREAVRCRAGTDAERNLEHTATGPWDAPQIVGQRIDELVEAGEADVRLVLHSAAMDHADTVHRGHLRRRVQQCRLAHSRLARQHERRTAHRRGTEERHRGLPVRGSRPIRRLTPALRSTIGHAPFPCCPVARRVGSVPKLTSRPATRVRQSFDRCHAFPPPGGSPRVRIGHGHLYRALR